MVVQPDTPGEITCTQLAEVGQCVVVADLLGDAVLWFALVPVRAAAEASPCPASPSCDDQNIVELTNGWVLRRAAGRRPATAPTTSPSLTEFVRRFGPSSTTTFSLDSQQIVKTTCTQAPEATTTTTVPASPPAVVTPPGDTAVPGDAAPDATRPGRGLAPLPLARGSSATSRRPAP